MIRKFGRLAAPVGRCRRLFRDVERWPDWMPGVSNVEVLDRQAARTVIRFDQEMVGIRERVEVEVVLTELGFEQRLLRGKARRWEQEWRFTQAGEEGTTVAASVVVDFGLWGRFLPTSLMEGAVDRSFEAILAAATTRLARAMVEESTAFFSRHLPSDFLLRIERDEKGLRVWFDGKHYRAVVEE